MRKYSYKYSAYGKMRDRQTAETERLKAERKQKEENYYTWLIQGK